MDTIKDVFNSIKERFSNPLIFSFVCFWLGFNWQIPVALIWYDKSQIESAGFDTLFDFIENQLGKKDSLSEPIFLAFVYTLFIPIINNLIKGLNSWASNWGDRWSLNLRRTGKISTSRYLKLREDLELRNKKLEEVTLKEGEYFQRYNDGQTEILNLRTEMTQMGEKLNEHVTFSLKLYDISTIKGKWKCSYRFPDGKDGTEHAIIEDSKYFIYALGSRGQKFIIRDFYYNNVTKEVFFIKELLEGLKMEKPLEEHIKINRLKLEDRNLMVGTENELIEIEYRREQ